MRIIALSLLALSTSAFATTLPIPLNGIDYFDSANSTGTWNIVEAHITGAVAPSGAHANRLNFGDGSDGAFNDGASTTGVTGSGTTSISISSTASKSIYNFTSFHLSSGTTLTVTGDRPITIRVLGTTTVDGTIAANGGNGSPNGGTGHNAGGTAGAGGGAGGRSGSTALQGDNGADAFAPTGANPTDGGIVGFNEATTASAAVGGGGACHGTGPDAGNDAVWSTNSSGINGGDQGTCAPTRFAVSSDFETRFTGGAGGGGGGAWTGAAAISGSGGGGGGGAIRLISLGAVNVTGSIQAKGGKGGNTDTMNVGTTSCGGAGGGGAGGSIWIQSASTISGAGASPIDVSAGQPGTHTLGDIDCQPGDGGIGSRGIFRADSSAAGYGAGPAQLPASIVQHIQVKPPASQTYVVYSKPIDFSARYISFSAVTETFACGTQTTDGTTSVTYEGSHDTVTWENSVSAANIHELNDYPYVRFKVSVATNASNATPPCLTGLTFNYDLKDLPELTLKGGLFCGRINTGSGRANSNDRTQGPGALFTDLALLAFAIFFARRRWRIVSQ